MHGRLVSSPPELVRNPADIVQALMTGRPPVIQRDYIDCKFPTPQAPLDEEEGEDNDDTEEDEEEEESVEKDQIQENRPLHDTS